MVQTRILTFAALAFLVVASADATQPAAFGRNGPPSPQDSNFTLEGKITDVVKGTPTKFTMNTEENMIYHVRVEPNTEIKRDDGSAGSESDLRPGVRAKVVGDLEESGEIKAQKIEIEPKPASPPK